MPVDLLALGLGVALAHAEPLPERVDGRAAEGAAPSPALLEFLGSWETADGSWVDPEELREMDLDTAATNAEATAGGKAARPEHRAPERKEDDNDPDD